MTINVHVCAMLCYRYGISDSELYKYCVHVHVFCCSYYMFYLLTHHYAVGDLDGEAVGLNRQRQWKIPSSE